TEVPQALSDALVHRQTRTLTNVAVPFGPVTRVLQVRVVPVDGGATLLWHDVTERTVADKAVKRSEERLALAADGANDGLWEWDLRSDDFFVSPRWKAMIGLSGSAEIARADDWLQRVHA